MSTVYSPKQAVTLAYLRSPASVDNTYLSAYTYFSPFYLPLRIQHSLLSFLPTFPYSTFTSPLSVHNTHFLVDSAHLSTQNTYFSTYKARTTPPASQATKSPSGRHLPVFCIDRGEISQLHLPRCHHARHSPCHQRRDLPKTMYVQTASAT